MNRVRRFFLPTPDERDIGLSYCLYAFARNPWAIGSSIFLAPLVLSLGAPDAFFSYCASATSFAVALVLPVSGSLADRTSHRREFLGLFTFIGCASIAMTLLLFSETWWLAAVILMISISMYESALVMSYAYMPDICETQEQLDALSARGLMWGNSGMLISLVVLGGFSYFFPGEWGTRMCVLATGGWWAAWTVLVLRHLPPSERQPGVRPSESRTWTESMMIGVREVKKNIAKVKQDRRVMLSCIMYGLVVDGAGALLANFATLMTRWCQASSADLAVLVVCAHSCGILAALGSAKLTTKFSTKSVCVVTLGAWILFTPFIILADGRSMLFSFGIPMMCFMGATFAVTITLTRSWFASFIPEGEEAGYFGLFEFAGLCTAWVSTLLFGVVTHYAGLRVAVISTLVFFVPAFVVALFVPNPHKFTRTAGAEEKEVVMFAAAMEDRRLEEKLADLEAVESVSENKV